MKKLFEVLDHDDNGWLDRSEISELGLAALSDRWATQHSSALMSLMDEDGDGKVTPEELEEFLVESLQVAFKELDHDGSGLLDPSELSIIGGSFAKQLQKYAGRQSLGCNAWIDAVLECLASQMKKGEVQTTLRNLLKLAIPVSRS